MDETLRPHLRPVLGLPKAKLYALGLELANQLLDGSYLRRPEYLDDHAYFRRGRGPGQRGFYRNGRVHTNLAACAPPTRTPGFAWSFPGYKADLTPVGVVCHEVGHHVDDLFGHPSLVSWATEPPVSGYEPDRGERLAEAVRLLGTNPDLLRCGRPRRWTTLVDVLGLVPAHDLPWEEVLRSRGAHEKHLRAAGNWVAAGRRDR